MVNYVRFADDFIITGENRELLQEQVLPIVRDFMAERGLQLSEEKTVITHIDKGFDFLGCNIRKYKGKLLIKPSKKNLKGILDKIRSAIKENPTVKQEWLIRKLNPMIRGWVNYQRFNVSARAFENLDYQIFQCLWAWCKRRHSEEKQNMDSQKVFPPYRQPELDVFGSHKAENAKWGNVVCPIGLCNRYRYYPLYQNP